MTEHIKFKINPVIILVVTAFISALLPIRGQAHSGHMSFFRLTQQENNWVLIASIAQATLQSYQPQHNGSTKDGLNKEQWNSQFKNKIANYLQDNLSIKFDGKQSSMAAKTIKLGSHESTVSFTLRQVPETFEHIDVKFSAFSEGKNHHNILFIITDSGKYKIILSARNDYTASLTLPKQQMSVAHD